MDARHYRPLIAGFLAVALSASSALAVEDLTLTSPVTRASTAAWRVDSMSLAWSAARIDVTFLDPSNGNTVTCSDTGASALSTMSTLNTANLTANSLQKRAITWAQGRGCLGAGTVAGAPQ